METSLPLKNIKNIIFDYGNVIFTIDFEKSQLAFAELGVNDVESIFAHSGQNALFDQLDKGMITAAEFRQGIREISGMIDLTDVEIDKAWNALLIGVPKGNHDVNDNSIFFEKDYYSHLMGMRKPNKDIFEYVLEEHGLLAEETVFIDDSPQHLETAKALGMHTILFNNPEELMTLMERFE